MTDTYLTAAVPDLSETETPTSVVAGRPSGVPEKFWDAQKKEIRTEALLSSYLALEKKLARMMPAPETPEDKIRVLKSLGMPETPDDYQVTLSNDLLSVDPEMNARLHGKGFTLEQVQEVYDLASEKLVPLILEIAAEFQAEREIERLVEAFGGPARWQEMARQLQDYGQKALPKAAFDGLACSYDGVMALYKMMQKDSGLPPMRGDLVDAGAADDASLRKMMQDPRYWRERNPAFIAQVSAGFEKLYGQKK